LYDYLPGNLSRWRGGRKSLQKDEMRGRVRWSERYNRNMDRRKNMIRDLDLYLGSQEGEVGAGQFF